MYRLLVTIQVADFAAFETYETAAVDIMKDHGGKIVTALVTEQNEDGSGVEIHLLEFEEKSGFEAYKSDSRLSGYRTLRDRAITMTEVKAILSEKSY